MKVKNSDQPRARGGVPKDVTRTDAQRAAGRVLWVGTAAVGLISLVLLGLLGRVVQLQAAPQERIAAMRDSQFGTGELLARRGAIVDRRGRVLAATRVAQKLFIDPNLIRDPNTFSERVGYNLGISPVKIERTMAKRPDSRYVVIDERMTDKQLREFEGLDLRGLATDGYLVRDYPHGDLAGQLLGFVGDGGRGLDGLELAWNKRLTAEPGQYTVLRNARRQALWLAADHYRAPTTGATARLTLDITIQGILQKQLAEVVEQYHAKSGQMIAMDPATGQILGLALVPTFDPNQFSHADPESRRNRAVTDVFEPGSIFKPIVWSAATQMGFADPDEMIDTTESGWWNPDTGPPLRDAHGHGELTWEQVLIYSSNIGMGKVAQRVGKDKLYGIIRGFGFGTPTGSGLPGEVGGIVRPLSKWSNTAITRVPMGQGVGVTGLQMMRGFATIANGGLLVTPRISFNRPAADELPIQQRVLTPAIAAHTRRVLREVVTEGTGRKVDSKLYTVFGKTGTAQLPNHKEGGYYQDRYVASFIGGAPTDHPAILIGCFIMDPDKEVGHYGGTVAGPAVKEAIEQSLLYLGVPPDGEENTPRDLATTLVSDAE